MYVPNPIPWADGETLGQNLASRGVSRRDYYRLAAAARDTADRPACRTAGGRVVHGGGGIYPDVRLPDPRGPPSWMARLLEDDLPIQWAGGYLSTAQLPALDSLAARPGLPAGALADFRKFAQGKGAEVPAVSGEEEARLERMLLRQLAFVKWGEPGYHQISAALDPVVRDAVRHFSRAAEVQGR